MSILPIVTAPDPRLRMKAATVDNFDDKLLKMIQDMRDTFYSESAYGLAAIQVGIPLRIIVIDMDAGGPNSKFDVIINPEIIYASPKMVLNKEACMSLPDEFTPVERHEEIKVRYQDEKGAFHEVHATGIHAICLQHEIDHLNGILAIDHLSRLKKEIAVRRLTKVKRLEQKLPNR